MAEARKMNELVRRGARYAGPAFVHVLAVFILWWSVVLDISGIGTGLALVVWLLASFWWFVRSVEAEAALWPDGAMIWIPALPWLLLAIMSTASIPSAAQYDDIAVPILVVFSVPALCYLIACSAVTIRLWMRSRRAQAHTTASVSANS